jgi:hypothetical protein
VQEIIAHAPGVRVLGSRHSFNDIADSSVLITLEAMPMDVVVDHAANKVSFNAALNYGEDTVGIHFTWKPERDAVEDVLVQLEAALFPFAARPHWGKLFNADAAAIAPLYERMPDFIRLVERLDPRGAFSNSWLRARVLGEP